MIHRAAVHSLRYNWVRYGRPLVLPAIVALSFVHPQVLNGFRDRPTSRVGEAVRRITADTDWATGREIFMPASLYLRFRILFPPELRDRLRVAVDDKS